MASMFDELKDRFNEKYATALALVDSIMAKEDDFNEKWEIEDIRWQIYNLRVDLENTEPFSASRRWYEVKIDKLTRKKERRENKLKSKVYALPEYAELTAVRSELLTLKSELKERFQVNMSMCMYLPY